MDSSEPQSPNGDKETRQRFRAEERPGAIHAVAHFLRENRWFWAAVFLVLVFTLFAREFRIQPPPPLPKGSVATRDLRAPFDFQVVDEVATAQKRQEARARVLPVYDWDSGKTSQTAAAVAQVFVTCRDRLERFRQRIEEENPNRAETRALEAELLDLLAADLGSALPRFVIRQFHGEAFSQELENQVQSILKEMLDRLIVPADDRFQGREAIRIRDIRKQDVEWDYSDPAESDILGLTDARSVAALRIEGIEELSGPMKGAIEEYVRSLLSPTLTFNSQETLHRQEQAASAVEPLVIFMEKGQVIIHSGELVDDAVFQKIEAVRREGRELVNIPLLSALLLFLVLILAFVFVYLRTYREQYHADLNLFVLFMQVAGAFILIDYGIYRLLRILAETAESNLLGRSDLYLFLIPVAAGAMLITILVDRHVGVIFSLLFAVLYGILMEMDFGMMIFTLLSSLTAVYGAARMAQKTAQWKAGLLVGAVNVPLTAAVLATDPIWERPLPGILFPLGMAFAAGAVLTPILVSPLVPLFESAFGILTEVRLMELASMDHPLLRRLAIEAPGTYNHSIMMASLCEAAAGAIGANSLLCRVGCYFHDVGKIMTPGYFVENQIYDQNPHDKLAPRMSSLVVASHVKDGMALARQYGLPDQIIDIIPQHHGTRKISFFYDKAKREAEPKGGVPNEADYSYPGPKPQTREAAVVMLADGVEAGSRVLKEPTQPKIRALIKEITDKVAAAEQLSECDLTFKDLDKVREAFYQILLGVFSRRISYPDFKFDKGDADDAS